MTPSAPEPDRVAVEVTVAAPADVVWRALRGRGPRRGHGRASWLGGLGELVAGERYAAGLVTGDELAGEVWFRAEHQLGLTVDGWGDGLLVVAEAPAGTSAVLTTYGLDAAALEALRARLATSWPPAA